MGHGVTWPVDDRLISPYSWMFGLFHQLRSPVTKLAVLLLGAFIDKKHQYVPIIPLSTTIFLASLLSCPKKSHSMNIKEPCSFFSFALWPVYHSVYSPKTTGLQIRICQGTLEWYLFASVSITCWSSHLSWRKFGEAMGTGKGYEEAMGFNGIS